RDAVFDLQHARLALVVVERSERVQRVDPRRLDRLLDVLVEHEYLQEHVEDLLILAVAAWRTDGQERLSVFQDQRGRERRPWPFATDEHVRAQGIQVEDGHAIRERYASIASHESATEQPPGARRGAEEVAVLVDDVDAGRIAACRVRLQ